MSVDFHPKKMLRRPISAFLICALQLLMLNVVLLHGKSLKFTPEKKNPVILIPGDGGSQMQAKLNKPSVVHFFCSQKTDYWFPIWLNLELITPLTIDCLVDNLRLVYDNKTRTTRNSPGVEMRIQGFGNTSSIEFLDESELSVTAYFNPIANMLVKYGYERGVSLRGAPFDFRKAANEMGDYFKDLRNLIEDTYYLNGNKRVSLIAHSMGNIVTLYFLNQADQAWKDKFVERFVTLGAPWGGAVKTIRVMASGDNLGVFVVRTIKARLEQRTMPSTTWMMPNPEFWKSDEVLVQTAEKNYTANDYDQFFEAIKFPVGKFMRDDTKNLLKGLRAPGVDIHCLHGSKIRTPAKFIWKKGYFPDYQPDVANSDGDGTVNLRSLLLCSKWVKEQKQKVDHKIFPGAEHMAMLGNKEVIDYIEKLIIGS